MQSLNSAQISILRMLEIDLENHQRFFELMKKGEVA